MDILVDKKIVLYDFFQITLILFLFIKEMIMCPMYI